MYYIPRTLIAKDEVLGEDRLSKFGSAYQLVMYFENIDAFGGQGYFTQKFGLMVEQSATLIVPRRKWKQFVGRTGATQLPERPNEGDLIYFPLTKGLFEIKFVQHQDPFFQLGKLYVYKLQVELFQYASEKIETGIPELDIFESLKSYDTDIIEKDIVGTINVVNGSNAITGNMTNFGFDVVVGESIVVNNIAYRIIEIIDDFTVIVDRDYTGTSADSIEFIISKLDSSTSYGDNWSFKEKASNVIFNTSNPFGEL
jgi:hypothetical protein